MPIWYCSYYSCGTSMQYPHYVLVKQYSLGSIIGTACMSSVRIVINPCALLKIRTTSNVLRIKPRDGLGRFYYYRFLVIMPLQEILFLLHFTTPFNIKRVVLIKEITPF